jgi:NitT/TauT family transport system permease protein
MSTTFAKPGRIPRRSFFLKKDHLIQFAIAAVAIIAWEILARLFHTEYYTSTPSAVVLELKRWAVSGELATDLRVTLVEAGVGFVIGGVVGGITGFILGWIRRLGDLLEPFILSLYTMPKIALAPLFVLWFGIGAFNKIMFAALLVFFMVFFTTYQGTRQVDRELAENARLLGAQKWDVWTKIAIPYAAVWVFTGIRIGLPYALIGAIVGEFVAAQAGVGFFIKQQSDYFNTAAVFAGLIVLMIISLLLLLVLRIFERWALRWQDAKGAVGTGINE